MPVIIFYIVLDQGLALHLSIKHHHC